MDLLNFGQYLLELRSVTPNQLLRAFDYQTQASPRFCEAAIALGLINDEQRDRLLQLQTIQGGRVGEVALRAELLTEAQVERVLRYQKSSHLMIGEALVATGSMVRADLQRRLEEFRKAQFAWINDGFPGRIDPTGLMAPAVLSTMRFLTEIANFPSRLGSCTVQERPEVPRPAASAVATLAGDFTGAIAVVGPLSVCAQLVTAMIGEPVDEADRAGIEDGLAEFLNLVGGDVVGRVAEGNGRHLEVVLPQPGRLPEAGPMDHLVSARLSVPGGELVLAVLAHLG